MFFRVLDQFAAPPRPTRRQMGSPSLFLSLPEGRFSDRFLLLFRILRNCAILRKLSSCVGESSVLCFQVAPNAPLSPLEPLPKITPILEAHECVGGGTPRENLSGRGEPLVVSKMLIRTGTRIRPKRTAPRRCLGTRLGAVGKML